MGRVVIDPVVWRYHIASLAGFLKGDKSFLSRDIGVTREWGPGDLQTLREEWEIVIWARSREVQRLQAT